MSVGAGTDLYRRTLAFDYGDQERSELMRKVWTPTPWMADVFTGSCGELREREILDWCVTHYGTPASPIHGRSGLWQRGSATVYGWTWFGFAEEADMVAFLNEWHIAAPTSPA